MKHRATQISRTLALLTLPLIAVGCAVPATEVAVATMPMRQALALTRIEASSTPIAQPAVSRLVPASPPPGAQEPLLGVPEVRLAYLYEWIDSEGNKHFGEWVAIPIAGFEWIMNDGTRAPVDSGTRDTLPQLQGP
jgi:hypothetical protein